MRTRRTGCTLLSIVILALAPLEAMAYSTDESASSGTGANATYRRKGGY